MTLITRIKRVNRPLNKLISRITRTREHHASQSPSTDTDIDHSKVLSILADDRRRYALEYIAAQPVGKSVSLSDLAEVVAARENDCSIEEVTSTQRERTYIALYQQHSKPLSELQMSIPTGNCSHRLVRPSACGRHTPPSARN